MSPTYINRLYTQYTICTSPHFAAYCLEKMTSIFQ